MNNQLGYQSYQSGIETVEIHHCYQHQDNLSIVPKWNWNFFDTVYTPVAGFYQSYQSGIETLPSAFTNVLCETINRTKVELKLNGTEARELFIILSIVPKWNWNKCTVLPFSNFIAINRTKVELKLFFAWLDKRRGELYQSYQSGIETVQATALYTLEMLSIVPKWNWNPIKSMATNSPMTINRTKVELKLAACSVFASEW